MLRRTTVRCGLRLYGLLVVLQALSMVSGWRIGAATAFVLPQATPLPHLKGRLWSTGRSRQVCVQRESSGSSSSSSSSITTTKKSTAPPPPPPPPRTLPPPPFFSSSRRPFIYGDGDAKAVKWVKKSPGSMLTEIAFQEKVQELRFLTKWGERDSSSCSRTLEEGGNRGGASINSISTTGAAEAALAALESLQSQAIPPLEIYNDVFACCVVASDWARALTVLSHIVSFAGLTPTLDTYKAALDATHQIKDEGGRERGQGGKWEKALRLYEAMLAAGVQPDGRIIEGVLLELAQVGMLKKGLEVIEEGKGLGVRSTKWMYRLLLGVLFRAPSPAVAAGAVATEFERGTAAPAGASHQQQRGKKRKQAQPPVAPLPPSLSPPLAADYYASALDALYGIDPMTGSPRHRVDDAACIFLVEEVFRRRGGKLTWKGIRPIVNLFLRDVTAHGEVGAAAAATTSIDGATAAEVDEGERKESANSSTSTSAFSESAFLLLLSLCKAAQDGEPGREPAGGALDGALLILSSMVEQGKGNTLAFNMVLKMCERRRDARRALLLLSQMESLPSLPPDLVSYNTVISACARGNRPQDAQRLVKAMEQRASRSSNSSSTRGAEGGRVVPSLVTYNSLLAALAQGGQWKEAMAVLQTLRRKGLKADVITYTSLIQACSKAKPYPQVKKALFFLDEMRGGGMEKGEEGRRGGRFAYSDKGREAGGIGVRPDAVAYAAAIEACARGGVGAGWGQTALGLYEEMKEEGIEAPPQVYRALVQACGNDVVPVGEEDEEEGKERKGEHKTISINRGRIDRNPKSASTLSSTSTSTSSSSSSTTTTTKMTTAKVWNLLQSCPPAHRNNFVYTAAVKACERGRDWRMALRLLEDMKTIRLEPDDVTHGQLLHVLSSTGRWAEALQVLGSIRKRNIRHYTSAIRACGSAKEEGEAARQGRRLYMELKGEGLVPDLFVYNVVLQALRAGSSSSSSVADDALALYDEMRGKTINLGNKSSCASFSPSPLTNKGHLPYPPPPPVAPDIVTITVLISILEKHGRHVEALRVFSDGVRANVLMTTRLDSLWERDLSRLSYQLVRAAIDYTLRELVKEFKLQKKAAAGSKEPNVNDLVLITGVDLRKREKGGVATGGGNSSSRDDPETRQGLACLVLREKGLVPAEQEVGEAGILKVPAKGLREWLVKQ
ncbi:hypothetical protein VYU27_006221 [Nannochloropsis oceanica]